MSRLVPEDPCEACPDRRKCLSRRAHQYPPCDPPEDGDDDGYTGRTIGYDDVGYSADYGDE